MKLFISIVIFVSITFVSCKKKEIFFSESNNKHVFSETSTQIRPTSLREKRRFFKGDFKDNKPYVQSISIGTQKIRSLIEIISSNKIQKFLLLESDAKGKILNFGYVFSKKSISQNIDLFLLNLNRDTVIFFDKTQFNNVSGIQSKHYKERLVQKNLTKAETKTVKVNSSIRQNSIAEPCDEPEASICIDWYWQTYDEYSGIVVQEEYIYTDCYPVCETEIGGNGGASSLSDLYICVGSFYYYPQGPNSNTNISRTWGIKGVYNDGGNIFSTIFGVTTYAPKDVLNFGNSWSLLNSQFYYLVNSGDIYLRTDNNGYLHLMYSDFAQSEISAAACDYASDNSNNPKHILEQPNGSTIYKRNFQTLYTNFLKSYIPGTTTQLIHAPTSGTTQATYSSNKRC